MTGDSLGENSCDEFGRDLAEIGNGERARRRVERLAIEIFADDPRRSRIAIEDGTNLILEQRALLLDHDDEIETLSKLPHDHGIKRPHHADFEEPQPKRGAVVVEAEIAQRLQEILPRLPRGDHAYPRALAIADDAVEVVGARIGERSRELVLVEPLFLSDRCVDRARPYAMGRSGRTLRDHDLWQVGADMHL